MTPEDQARVAAAIDEAHQLAERRADAAAAKAFALARELTISLPPRGEVDAKLNGLATALGREREQYRTTIAGRRRADRTLVILGDSLGLPRPDDKSGDFQGADRTYPMLALDRLGEHMVQSYCQRYWTMNEVVAILQDDPTLGRGADVMIHIGLNDCANRMFVERERLAMDLLAPETKDRIVGFAQRYRRQILAHLPPHHFVPPDEFRMRLDDACRLLRERDARRVVLTTIILPPIKFWPGTPGVQRNFGHYNQMIMDAVARNRVTLFDLDRHVWARQGDGVLLDDGMHLSLTGHRMVADELAKLVA